MKVFLKILLSVFLLCSLGINGYLIFFDEVEDKFNLPVYEVTYTLTGEKDIVNNVDLEFVSKYKLINKIDCMYDLCFWYDYGVSTIASAKWIYYDNNKDNDGGYYLYDQKKQNVMAGPFKDVKIDVDNLGEEILQGVYLYNYDGKVGYYNLRGSNQMLFDVKFDTIESSPYHNFYVSTLGEDVKFYSFFNNKLNEVTEEVYDSYSFVKGRTVDYLISVKDGYYNFVYENMDLKALETNDNYDYLDVYEVSNKEYYNDYELFFIYVEDGKTFISKTTIDELIETNSLTPNLDFNYKISEGGEEFVIADGNTDDTIYLYPSLEDNDEYFIVNINDNTVEKKVVENQELS